MNKNYIAKLPQSQPITNEMLEFMGLQFRFSTPLTDTGNDFCLIHAELAPGGFVPLHSHKDHEIFFILSGELEGYGEDSWQTYRTGETFDIPSGIKHAYRNASGRRVEFLGVTTMNLGGFLYRLARRASTHPGASLEEKFKYISEASLIAGYWLASPEENALAGVEPPAIN